MIFHDLDQEQYESLKENKKLCNVSETECEDCEPDAGLCVAAEMKNVSWRMFARTQKIGKKIGIVANLAPRPMMKGKYVSEGMIFAADTDVDGGCSIAFFPDSTPAGARIH
ncbi:MAG: hypothetical protein EGR85_04915 [Subdoligranulum sp.]|nr:hypothetical protein [Subdoligranulum sp.]